MKRIFVDISSELNQVPDLQEILPREIEAASLMKEQGVLEHVFVKSGGAGAILIFKDVEEPEVKELVATLPLAPYFGTIEYTVVEKHF
jgi:muconolactone delta-isomerase